MQEIALNNGKKYLEDSFISLVIRLFLFLIISTGFLNLLASTFDCNAGLTFCGETILDTLYGVFLAHNHPSRRNKVFAIISWICLFTACSSVAITASKYKDMVPDKVLCWLCLACPIYAFVRLVFAIVGFYSGPALQPNA